ncbi:hypothetical protein ACH3XW_28245 [Acanthocheilonema viteae]
MTTFSIRVAKKHLKRVLLIFFVVMVLSMVKQFKNTEQKQAIVIEKICSKEFQSCLLIKDETFDDGGQNSVLRTLVPEKFPDFIVAQVILQTFTGWKSWLPQFNRAQCHAIALLPADYQQIMLTAPFLTGSLRKVNDSIESSRVLLVGLGARTIGNYIHYHLFRVEIDELVVVEKDQYLNKVWLNNSIWRHITIADIREKNYNAVFIDTCLNAICPPTRIIETAAQLNKTIKEDGILIVNVNAPAKSLLHRTIKRVNDSLSKTYGCFMIANRNSRMAPSNIILLYWKLSTITGCQKVKMIY